MDKDRINSSSNKVKHRENPYDNGYLNKQLLQTLNKQVFKEGLISEEIFRNVKIDIEKMKDFECRSEG